MEEKKKLKIEHPKAENGFITPNHYMNTKYQHIEIQESYLTPEEFVGFCKGLIIKYLCANRDYDLENKIRAAKKANYYLTELINYLSATNNESIDHTKPSYFKNQSIEPIEIIEDRLTPIEYQGYCRAMVYRYIDRSAYKGHEFDDFIKASYYLNRYIEALEKGDRLWINRL